MDVKLIGRALQFHGVDLLHSLREEQHEEPSSAFFSHADKRQPQDQEIRDPEFHKNLCTFIGRKSDLLFRPLTDEDKTIKKCEENIDDSFAIMPPLEVFMDVPGHDRREHLFKSLKQDDCVTGVVTSILDNGLRIHLLCVDRGCVRDIEDLNIVAFCPAKELPKLYAGESALDAFQEKDIVRGIVLSVIPEAERIILSLHGKAIPDANSYPRIGLISEDEFPVTFRRKSQKQGMGYSEMMHSILGFNNQGNVKALMSQLYIQDASSYLRCHARLKIPEKEYAEGLKKWQSQKLAHQSVAQGVEKFKEGQYLEAMQHFNRALQIDDDNVEALVARGALYANKENFNHAIQDFEEALKVNPKHNNARNYLIETLLTVGKMFEDRRQLDEACDHYMRVLQLDPDHLEAKEMLTGCQHLMNMTIEDIGKARGDPETSDGEGRGKVDVSDLTKTTEKLRQLIQEDKRGKRSYKKKKKQHRHSKRSHSRDARQKKRGKRSRSSSSDVSSEDSSSSSSSSSQDSKHKRSRKNCRRNLEDDDCRQVRSRFSDSPSGEKKLREDVEKEKRLSATVQRQEEAVSAFPSKKKKSVSPVTAKMEDGPFVNSMQASAVTSLFPVSSLDVFGQPAIPGLGSPPPAGPSSAGASKETSAFAEGRNMERERDTGTMLVLRRNDLLMAEREKFYKDNRERYKRFRPHSRSDSSSSRSSSSSPSSSHSRSPGRESRSRRRSRSGSSTRRPGDKRSRKISRSSRSPVRLPYSRSPRGLQGSRSPSNRSQTRHTPVITGVKELDMYLGGTSKAFQDIQAGDKYTTWESFIGHALPGRMSDGSKSRDERSSSPKYTKCRSSRNLRNEFQSRKSHDSLAEVKTKPEYGESCGKGKSSQRNEKVARSKKELKADYDPAWSKDRGGKYSRDLHSHRHTSRSKMSSSSRKQQEKTANKDEGKMFSESKEETVDIKDKISRRDISEDTEIHRPSGGFGKFYPHKNKETALSGDKGVGRTEPGHHDSPHAIYKSEELSGDLQRHPSKLSKPLSEREPKFDFMPRILRMPKMDDPALSKPLLSSNQLAALERQKKESKSSENAAESDGKNIDGTAVVREGQEKGRSASMDRSETKNERDRIVECENSGNSDRSNWQMEIKQTETGCTNGNEDLILGQDIKKDVQEEVTKHSQKFNEGEDGSMGKIQDADVLVAHPEDRKWLEADEIEKEIERRVQQRLQEEGAKLQAAVEREVKVIRRSRWDDEEPNIKSLGHFSSTDVTKSKVLQDDPQQSGKSGSSKSVPIIEQKIGWSRDFHGNKNITIRGQKLLEGGDKYKFGDPFYGRDDHEFPQNATFAQLNQGRHAEGVKDTISITSRTPVRASQNEHSHDRDWHRTESDANRRQSRARDKPSSRNKPDRTQEHTNPYGEPSLYTRRGRDRSRSTDREKHASQSRSRSRSGSRDDSPRRSSSRSKSQSTAKRSSSDCKQVDFQSKSFSGDETKSGGESSHDIGQLKRNPVPNKPLSRWDSQNPSRWDNEEKTKESSFDKAKHKRGRQTQESLSELEKFLIDLKQQKKRQWIAEGKLKEKD